MHVWKYHNETAFVQLRYTNKKEQKVGFFSNITILGKCFLLSQIPNSSESLYDPNKDQSLSFPPSSKAGHVGLWVLET
jgi:hypothetical protein